MSKTQDQLNEEFAAREQANHEYELKYRTEIAEPLDKQECVRRNIEALTVAARHADTIGGDAAKTLKKEIGEKLEEHVKALKPLS